MYLYALTDGGNFARRYSDICLAVGNSSRALWKRRVLADKLVSYLDVAETQSTTGQRPEACLTTKLDRQQRRGQRLIARKLENNGETSASVGYEAQI